MRLERVDSEKIIKNQINTVKFHVLSYFRAEEEMASGENYSSALASAKTNSIGATKLIDNELYGT